jgi:Ca-activated chloride channel family protein
MSYTLANPWFLLLLLPLLFLVRQTCSQRPLYDFLLPNGTRLSGNTWRTQVAPIMPWFSLGAMVLLLLALARPQIRWTEQRTLGEGLDIALAIDISPSMLSKDFYPDRITVAKNVAADFVLKRPHDRIAIIGFSAEAFTQCPLTADHEAALALLNTLSVGILEDGTAIGMGLATALNRVKDSESIGKVVILLTDGENNAGYIPPLQAAEIARQLQIRVYTIGIGSDGIVMSPSSRNRDGSYNFSPRRTTFDTQLLQNIASTTQARFFRARNSADLADIYADIDQLEKTDVETLEQVRFKDLFGPLLGFAIVLLAAEKLMQWLILRRIL